MPIWEYNEVMARASTTADVFNAIAEPRRRQIINVLKGGREHAVGDLVIMLKLSQPTVSKHLGVLRKVGIVSVHKQGQQRLYRLEAEMLKPVHEWVKTFERYWTRQILRIKDRAERQAAELLASESDSEPPHPSEE